MFEHYLQDYFVLLPAAYYEAAILVDHVTTPCRLGESGTCRYFSYPNLTAFDQVQGEGAYVVNGDTRDPFLDNFLFSLSDTVSRLGPQLVSNDFGHFLKHYSN